MGLITSGILGARKLLGGRVLSKSAGEFAKSAGQWFRGSRLNPGSYAEDLIRGLGVRTRSAPVIGTKEALSDILDIEGNTIAKGTKVPVLGDKTLNAAGWTAQLAGGLGVAGTLGYRMFGGQEPAVDANGVKNPMHNEEIHKIRDDFQKEKMGGSKHFSQPILDLASKESEWVKTAIDVMGLDRYKQLRKMAVSDPKYAEKLHHELVSSLATTGDEEMMKQAGTEPYVLPGLAKFGEKKKVVVMNPMQSKDKSTHYIALSYDYKEGDEE